MADPLPPDSRGAQTPPVLIVGASTRAAAQSAVRSGRQPLCVDLFADLDLQTIARCTICEDYPRGLPRLTAKLPPAPWMYTGALENAPDVIEQISQHRILFGNPAHVVRAVRRPVQLQQLLAARGFPALETRDQPPSPANALVWLRKPKRSAGGMAIAACAPTAASGPQHTQDFYWQEHRAGSPASGLYLATARQTFLLGVAEQFVGTATSSPPSPFAWCGGIAPHPDEKKLRTRLEAVGQCVADAFQLRGLFGCDFIDDGRQAWLLEVNPRYTASAELHELARNMPLLHWHILACASGPDGTVDIDGRPLLLESSEVTAALARPPARCVAKQIVYAEFDAPAPDWSDQVPRLTPDSVPALADIPQPNSPLQTGHPVCTVAAAAPTANACRDLLRERVSRVREQLAANRA